jgi:hypothetical protein
MSSLAITYILSFVLGTITDGNSASSLRLTCSGNKRLSQRFREIHKICIIPDCRNQKHFSEQVAAMHMMLRFTLPVEKSNAAINDGSLGRTMESILSKLKPEAAYFTPLEGKRGGMIFFDMAEPSQIVESVEPFFLSFNASTELVPVMNTDDLRKRLAKVAGK